MPSVFHFYSDPGHGWLRVHLLVLAELGLLSAISNCSYLRGDCAYLEEDADYSRFIEAFEAKYRRKPIIRELPQADRSSRIRNYESYDSSVALILAADLKAKKNKKGKRSNSQILTDIMHRSF